MTVPVLFAYAGGSWIFLAFVVILLLAVVFGYYTSFDSHGTR